MDTNYQKKLAAKILKCGISRIKVEPSKEVEEALTREDVRNLIKKGLIKKIEKRGPARSHSRFNLKQKKRGRKKGRGSKKGTKKSRAPPKEEWIRNTRAMRRMLKELKEKKKINNVAYKPLYRKIKGGFFRNKNHLMLYLKDSGLLKEEKT